MNDAVLQSFFSEIEKIAREDKRDALKRYVGRYVGGAVLGTVGGLALGTPMLRSIAEQYGTSSARDIALLAIVGSMTAGTAAGGASHALRIDREASQHLPGHSSRLSHKS